MKIGQLIILILCRCNIIEKKSVFKQNEHRETRSKLFRSCVLKVSDDSRKKQNELALRTEKQSIKAFDAGQIEKLKK